MITCVGVAHILSNESIHQNATRIEDKTLSVQTLVLSS